MAATYTYNALGRRIGIDDSGRQIGTVYNRQTADDNPYADVTTAARSSCGMSTGWSSMRCWHERIRAGTPPGI